jgi:hypothetical protein
MRTVEEYRAKAREFEKLSVETAHPELKQSYRDLAKSYRALAAVRERAIGDGTVQTNTQLPRSTMSDPSR